MILAKFSMGRRDKRLIALKKKNRKKYIGIINDSYRIISSLFRPPAISAQTSNY